MVLVAMLILAVATNFKVIDLFVPIISVIGIRFYSIYKQLKESSK